MRTSFVAFASVLAATVAATSVAHADPASVSANADTTAAPSTYVAAGAMAGGNDGLLTMGGNAEVGRRVAPNVWVHASFTEGAAGQLFATGDGSITQVRVGADLISCGNNGILCAFLGADVGFQHTQFSGMSTPLFCDGDANDCEGNAIDQRSSGAIGVARAGLDIGGTHLRWRPGLEVAFANGGPNGFNLTQSLAYRF